MFFGYLPFWKTNCPDSGYKREKKGGEMGRGGKVKGRGDADNAGKSTAGWLGKQE